MPTGTKKAATRPLQTDPDLVPIDSDVEVWRNGTPGVVYINKIGEYGRRITELVQGGRTIALTPQERRVNQNGYATPAQDLFTNGTLQPISLVDGEVDTAKLRQNPNTLTDRDIQKLFKLRGEAFQQKVDEITSSVVLTRVLEMAREPRHDVTLAQYEVIKLRDMALKGDLEAPAPAADDDPNTAGLPRAVTPR